MELNAYQCMTTKYQILLIKMSKNEMKCIPVYDD